MPVDKDKIRALAERIRQNGKVDVNRFVDGGPDVPLTDDQVKSAVEYLEKYIRKHNIPLENITTHEIVRDNWLKSHSGDEARRKGVKPKHDLSPAQWGQVIEALKRKVYYEKSPKGFDISDYRVISDLLTRRPVDVLTDRDDWDYAKGGTLLMRYEDGGLEGDIDLPYSGGGYSGGRAGDPREVAANSSNKYLRIGNGRYWSAYDSLVNGGATPEDSDRLARILAAQSALETGWVDRNDTNNYAGYRYNGKNMSFGSPAEFWDYHIKNLDEKWPGWRDADSVQAYYNIVNHPDLGLTTREKFDAYNRSHRDNPVYIYAPDWENENYLGKLKSVYDRYINKYVPALGNALSGGGGIHIKKSHKGLFTAKAKRAGQGVQEYASHVLANKEDYPSSTVKQAAFAKAASKWHSDGGAIHKALDNGDIDVIRAAINNVLARKISGK